jgi:hypothetical protein
LTDGGLIKAGCVTQVVGHTLFIERVGQQVIFCVEIRMRQISGYEKYAKETPSG